jgi:hypothetical protein
MFFKKDEKKIYSLEIAAVANTLPRNDERELFLSES